MIKNDLEKLEYYKVLQQLASFCVTYLGTNQALTLSPSYDKTIVAKKLQETQEAVIMLTKNSTPPISEIADNTVSLKILKASGVLSITNILEITKILTIAYELKKYIAIDYIDPTKFPVLSSLFAGLYTNPSIIEKIRLSITEEKAVADKASSALQAIRRKQRNMEQNIKNKLHEMIHSSHYNKYIQESVITIRNDRYVIPIKEEYRSQVKGLVHDISSSGSTVFIEPISIFELNNEFNNLKIEESLEIEKILQELSALFYPYVEELSLNLELIGALDFIFAKAKYSQKIQGNTPNLAEKKEFTLIQARHPLLEIEKAVPITVSLGKNFNTLVITGPNTGGKTVTLKTVGLLSYMACSGLNIPADENSSIYVFDHIYADIGDEQSISDSLSTFSSHMINIVSILKQANENSLVLMDELGSGTDPIEGAALAISILKELKDHSILTIATTHYQELKKFALVEDGFENASVEFDLTTLSPTYRLLIGVPGKSNAFEISQKLGLKKEILEKATSLLNREEIHFEEILKNIHDNQIAVEKQKQEYVQKLKHISHMEEKLKLESCSFLQKQEEKIEKAKVEARNILLEAKEEANRIIRDLSASSTQKQNEIRNILNDRIKNLSSSPKKEHIEKNVSLKKEDLKQNTEVFVIPFEKNGVIVSSVSKSNEVQVQIGSMKITLPLHDLKLQENTSPKTNLPTSYSRIFKTKNVKSEINLIGYTVEEAIFVVDKFLDDATLAKLETVRIVHGKGTGKLKNGIHQFLKNNLHVKDYRMGNFGEGEMGVTVVTLK